MEERELIINKIISEVIEKFSSEDKVVIHFKDIIGEYGVSFSTAYTIMAILEKKLQKIIGDGVQVFRRRGKLIIVKKEESEEKSKIEELKNYYVI